MAFSIKPQIIPSSSEIEMEVYVKYATLHNATLFNLLQGIERIKNKLIAEYRLDYELTKLAKTSKKIKPSLELTSIHTGKSIIWVYKEGWVPSMKPKDGNLEISLNYKIGLTALIIGALAAAIPNYLSSRNAILDNELKRNEIELKQLEKERMQIDLDEIRERRENEKLLQQENTNLGNKRKYGYQKSDEELTEYVTVDFLNYVHKNDKIEYMKINDIVLKNDSIDLRSP
jgi:hypothetical protein